MKVIGIYNPTPRTLDYDPNKRLRRNPHNKYLDNNIQTLYILIKE